MVNIQNIVENLNHMDVFTRADMQSIMVEHGLHATASSTSHMINRLMASGDIARVGRNQYCVSSDGHLYSYDHSDQVNALAEEIRKAHPYLDFRIFELVQLNEFIDHQIANNIIFVSVESDLGGYVFDTLWENHHGSVLLRPAAEDVFRYLVDDLIIIGKLPSESPKGKPEFWDTRIEKMLVDIAVDKLLRQIVSSGEYPALFHNAIQKYTIDKSVMTRYARRRGALDKFRRFLRNDARLPEEVFSI